MARISRILEFGFMLMVGLSAAQVGLAQGEPVQSEAAQDPSAHERRLYQITKSTSPAITIDGRLDEAAWTDGLSLDLLYEWEPGENIEPPVKTRVYVLYDDTHLYVAFRAYDPDPSAIRAHFMDRDEVSTFVQDDHVVFQVDTFDDQRRAFQFRVNPYGIQADAVFNQAVGEDFSWDVVWRSAGSIDDQGWSAELAIPFHQLRFPKSEEAQTWGVDFGRSYPRLVRHRIAANPFSRSNNCLLCQVPRIAGFEGLSPGLGLEIAPTVTVNRVDVAPELGADLESGDEDTEAGLSIRWSPTTSLTLNATLNPDFSQVEADAAQLQVNERFALQFPEKRPFFLEGADFFGTPIETLFTRSIANPEWGLKLTGKMGASAIGFLAARDEINNVLLPANNFTRLITLDGGVDNAVARWRRDIGDASNFGLMITDREGDNGYHNRVATADGDIFFNPRNRFQWQASVSDTQYPLEAALNLGQPADAFGGQALQGIYFYGDRLWNGSLGYRTFSRGFRADSGFVPRVDFETWRGDLFRTFWGEEDDWYTNAYLGFLALRTVDQNGRLTDQKLQLSSSVSGPLQSSFNFSVANQDQISGDLLFEDLAQYNAELEMQPSGSVRLGIEADWGEAVDFVNSRQGDLLQLEFELELKIGDHMNAQVELLQRDLDVEGGRLFRAELAQMQLVYQFDARMFIRGIFQYESIDRDPSLYLQPTGPDFEELFSQLLFSYKINPQTVAFLGYTETRLGLDGSDLELDDRALFFKLGYAWIR